MVWGKIVAKFIFIVLNIYFGIAGLSLIAMCIQIINNHNSYAYFLKNYAAEASPEPLPIFLAVAGGILFAISFLGCFLSIKERYHWFLVVFIIALLTAVVIQFIVGLIVIADFKKKLTDSVKSRVSESLSNSIRRCHLNNNTKDLSAWDVIQLRFTCCGINSPEDWEEYLEMVDYHFVKKHYDIPRSCCGDDTSKNCTRERAYQKGCYSAIIASIERSASHLHAGGTGVAVLEVIGIIFAMVLFYIYKNEYQASRFTSGQ